MKKINLMPDVAPLLIALALAAAWMWCNAQALLSLHLRWLRFDEPYAVGYPAVLLALWWVWRHRTALHQRCAHPSRLALLLLAATLLAGAAARLVQLMLLQQLAALASAWLILVTLLGWSVGRFLIFPFALLSLGIPLWDFLVDPLRAMTVWFTQHMLDMLNIPAHVDGFLIGLPAGTIEVAGGCSGLNLFLAMALVGLLFAESHHVPRLRRVAIVALAGLIGILDNWVRVFALVVIAHVSGIQNHLVQHHGSFGWWIYAGGLLPYFWLAGKVERAGLHMPQSASTSDSLSQPPFCSKRLAASSLLMLILMLAVTAGAEHLEGRRGTAERGFAAPGGALPVAADTVWLPHYSGQDVTQTWRVMRDGRDYDVVALTYIEQRNDKKLIYYSNRIAAEHAVRASGLLSVAPGFSVNTATIQDGGGRLVWWFWWVDGAVSTSALKTKILQLRAMLFGDPSAALIAVTVPCAEDCRTTQAIAQNGVLQLLKELRNLHIEH